jgi:hypothetical protein
MSAPLTSGVYGEGYPPSMPGSAGMLVTGQTPFAACTGGIAGEFQVFDYVFMPPSSAAATISFRQWCLSDPSNVVSGCVHIE